MDNLNRHWFFTSDFACWLGSLAIYLKAEHNLNITKTLSGYLTAQQRSNIFDYLYENFAAGKSPQNIANLVVDELKAKTPE
jgi:hypothetical protein